MAISKEIRKKLGIPKDKVFEHVVTIPCPPTLPGVVMGRLEATDEKSCYSCGKPMIVGRLAWESEGHIYCSAVCGLDD